MRKAKIISYKNIEETQVTHIIKDTTKGQKKLGQKYKSAVPEIDELEAEAELEIAHNERGLNGEEETWSEAEKCCTRGR